MRLIIVDLPLYWCIDTIARDTTYAILVSVLVTDSFSLPTVCIALLDM